MVKTPARFCSRKRDFEIKTDHRTSVRSPNLLLINKEKGKRHQVHFVAPANYKVKKEKKKIESKVGQKTGLCKRAEKVVEHEGDSDAHRNVSPWNGLKRTWEIDLVKWRLKEEMQPSRIQLC